MSWPGGKIVKWTAKEDAALIAAWKSCDTTYKAMFAAAEACPGRSPHACEMRASRLGLTIKGGERKNAAEKRDRHGKVRASDAVIVEMRLRGLSVAEIAEQGHVLESHVHKVLDGKPRRLRFRGEDVGVGAL